jgi:hypothetical protein
MPTNRAAHTSGMAVRAAGLTAVFVALALTAGVGGASPAPARAADRPATAFTPVGPLRLADTRDDECGCTRPAPTTIRVDVAGRPGVPPDATAAVVTVTALPAAPGYVTAFPAATPRPPTSTVNTLPDRAVANTTIVLLGDGALDVYASGPTGVVVDLVGVFVPADHASAGRFQATPPRRLLDTRTGDAPPAPPGSVTHVPLPPEMAGAAALAINVTHVGSGAPGHVSIATTPGTSFLNTIGQGAVAATVIAPVVAGMVSLYDHAGGHLVVDVTGSFTGPGAHDSADGLFVPLTPTRLRDTRDGGRIWAGGTIELPAPVPDAVALVTNVTVTRPDRAGYVSAYPGGTARPLASAVNPSYAEHTLANLAITPISTRGAAYYGSTGTDLVVDLTGYFIGVPVAATEPPAPNDYPPPRVLLIGDSGLRGVAVYSESLGAFDGIPYQLEAAGCRRLHEVSCTSPGSSRPPPTALDVLHALAAAGERFEYVVVTAGHNDSYRFELGFTRVVVAARDVGAHTIIWQNYSALSEYGHLDLNSALLSELTARPEFGDVRLADWRSYTLDTGSSWLWDGIHMTNAGAWGQTDYLARWIAALEHRPCPAAWAPDEPVPDPCPRPDAVGRPTDPAGLYGG